MRPAPTILLTVALAGLVACSAEEGRPSSERDGASRLVGAPPDGDGVEGGGHTRICEPGASEICFLTVVKEDGSVECPESLRFCAEDGTQWHACGHFEQTADGRVMPPSEDTPPPDHAE